MLRIMLLSLLLSCVSLTSAAQAPEKPFVVEYYYQAQWGHAEEFLQLFKKNHLPVLQKQVELGRLLSVKIEKPRYHATEDGRWDFRVTLTFKSAATAFAPFDEAALAKQLYPDQATFRKEEQRRFEILKAHWDVPIVPVE
ncbi:MAG: hypothetical protein HOP19_10270 [Acidobacteria bacterium]|nr:hypothetical protein [Acidobacteriota bacterium]